MYTALSLELNSPDWPVIPLQRLFHNRLDGRAPLSSAQIQHLQHALLQREGSPSLEELSQSGELSQWIPEWNRMLGPDNYQHKTHDFPLDHHTMTVVHRTRDAQWFDTLSERHQWMTLVAALLHDIGKTGGPLSDRPHLSPDSHHPQKSMTLSRSIVPALGLSPWETEWICRLVLYHQLFGSMIIQFPDWSDTPPSEVLARAAFRIGDSTLWPLLMALTEGDIRGVKDHDALFDRRVAAKLDDYGKRVLDALHVLDDQQQALWDVSGTQGVDNSSQPQGNAWILPLQPIIANQRHSQPPDAPYALVDHHPVFPITRLSTLQTYCNEIHTPVAGVWVDVLPDKLLSCHTEPPVQWWFDPSQYDHESSQLLRTQLDRDWTGFEEVRRPIIGNWWHEVRQGAMDAFGEGGLPSYGFALTPVLRGGIVLTPGGSASSLVELSRDDQGGSLPMGGSPSFQSLIQPHIQVLTQRMGLPMYSASA